ncbi:MAG: DUF3820 family protein [Spirochaetota bacterium]
MASQRPEPMNQENADLIALANTKMPFGKYAGRYLVNLPEPYLVWFKQHGFPTGELGRRLEAMLELKTNGLEYLVRPLIIGRSDRGGG